MTDTLARPRFAVIRRRCALIAVSLVAVMQSSSVTGAQNAPANEPFARAARRAIAHGRPGDAEALAKARPADDPVAAAVLARLAIARGAFDEALRILEGPAAADPRSDAALELGLLQQRLGHQEQGNRLLTAISNAGGARSDGESLLRAGRAAQALKRAAGRQQPVSRRRGGRRRPGHRYGVGHAVSRNLQRRPKRCARSTTP